MNQENFDNIIREVAKDTSDVIKEEIVGFLKSKDIIVVGAKKEDKNFPGSLPKEPNPDAGTDAYVEKTAATKVIIEGVSHVQQAFHEWGDQPMGEHGHEGGNIQKDGCALSALSAIAAFHLKMLVNPLTLNKFLADNGGYMYGDKVVWGKITTLLQRYGLMASNREAKAEGYHIDIREEIRGQIDQDNPVILRARHSKGPHFLVGIGYVEEQSGSISDIITHDPGTRKGNGYGTEEYPPSTFYGNPNHEFTLEGVIIYEVSGTPQRPGV